jgi:sulfatase modifying factor 1
MNTTTKMLAAVLLSCTGGFAVSHATVVLDMTTVGNIGNSADTNGYGSVGYEYQIGIYEVTNAQYAEFLNEVAKSDPYNLYNVSMNDSSRGGIVRSGVDGAYVYTVKDGFANKPVNYVSFADAARFSNWLTNGQGSSSIETGSYNMSDPLATMTRMTAQPGQEVQYFVASQDEWYKAAYYDAALGGYWAYPTQSNSAPTASAPSGLPNRANFANFNGVPTDVGAYTGSFSYYGTFDQEGNMSELTDTITGVNRVRRGSSYSNSNTGSGYSTSDAPTGEAVSIGFRIVMVTVPEPSTAMLMGGSVIALGIMRRKRISLN